jgi:branched-chain amino acid transport system substrate-binding protein
MPGPVDRSLPLRLLAPCLVVLLCLGFASTAEAQGKPVRIGIVTFLSGPAAGPFGVPAKNSAELVVEALNAGRVPAPYTTKGLGGSPIELVFMDEAGGTTKQVSEYRNLVQRQNVDFVVGFVSSGDCLAVAPVAEELKKLTLLFDCGTPRLFEEASYRYVFRPVAHATMDSVGAALYVQEHAKALTKIAGLNQNYAWGQDSWNDFEAAMKALRPNVETATSQMPKLLAGQYGAEVSALLAAKADVIHSSFWGGDLEAFVLQASPRQLFKKSMVVLTAGETVLERFGRQIPDGTVIGARGTNGMLAPDNALNRWFRGAYQEKVKAAPTYPTYHMAQSLLGLKAAYEKAQAQSKGSAPSQDQVISAFEGLSFESPSGKVAMSLGKGHQAVQGTAYGMTRRVGDKVELVQVTHYPPEKVTPPEGVKSADWLKGLVKTN